MYGVRPKRPREAATSDPHVEDDVTYDVTEANLCHDPRLLGLYQLWHSKRGGRFAPARVDIRAEQLQPWLGNLILLDVIDGGKDFRYRLFGSVIAREAGFDLTGKFLSDYPIESR